MRNTEEGAGRIRGRALAACVLVASTPLGCGGHVAEPATVQAAKTPSSSNAGPPMIEVLPPLPDVPLAALAAQEPPPPPRPPKGNLGAEIAQATAGTAPQGPPFRGRLETYRPMPLSVQRGVCYTFVFRLGNDAKWSPHAAHGVDLLVQEDRLTPRGERQEIIGGTGIEELRGGVFADYCPEQSGPIDFDVQAIWGSATSKARLHDLGRGSYTIQVFAKYGAPRPLF